MNFFKSMSEEERRRYGIMSKEEKEAFRREKERKTEEKEKNKESIRTSEEQEKQRDSGRRVETNVFDIPGLTNYTNEIKKGTDNSIREYNGIENRLKMEDKIQQRDTYPVRSIRDKTAEERMRKSREHSYIYIQFVMDMTYSFSRVFPAVYHAVQVCMDKISEKKKEFPDIRVRYGLVTFNDKIESVRFDGSCFTESEHVFMDQLRKMRFTGGSPNEYEENINEAVEAGLRNLEKESEEYANRGLLLLTDSIPKERKPDFYSLDGCQNRGLRFAVCYLYNDEYVPRFKITDRDGDITENGKNRGAEIRRLESLFGSEGMKTIQKQIDDIMYKSSVLIGMQ